MDNLKEMRRLAGLSQYDLARVIRASRTRISEAENGHIRLAPHEVSRINEAVNTALRQRLRAAGVTTQEKEIEPER